MAAPAASMSPSLDLYSEVLQFHSRQLMLLDDGLYDHDLLAEWSQTMTENAEHWVDSMPAPKHGREAILAAQKTNPISRWLVESDLIRRHLVTNLVVDPRDDGTIHSTYYVQIVDTARRGATTAGTTTVVRETLVREGGSLRTARRKVSRDDLR